MPLQQGTKFWLVWSPRGHVPTKKHQSFEIAEGEADRLAKIRPGRHFYVLECVGFAMEGENQPTKRQAERAAAQKAVDLPAEAAQTDART